tara:strand:- start:11709 stop:11912 length:204 start_codon:yes stop_codon:yes gene_type:complete
MYSYSEKRNTFKCEVCNDKLDTTIKGIQLCKCGKYTFTYATRPHSCGCRGKMEDVKSVSYDKVKDYL